MKAKKYKISDETIRKILPNFLYFRELLTQAAQERELATSVTPIVEVKERLSNYLGMAN